MGPHGQRWILHASLAALSGVWACATLGSETSGETNSPTSGVGPFRKLGADEVVGVAPFVFHSQESEYREPAALPLDDDPASTRVALYATANVLAKDGSAHAGIARSRADDARSFYGDGASLGSSDAPALVLSADAAWEGGDVRAPSAVRVGSTVYLYYAAAGGIGLAVSNDGLLFQKGAAPVLAPDASVAWETTAPAQPSVAIFPDGSWHMLYAAGVSIGEATSADGRTWLRVDGDPTTPAMDPVLAPSPIDPSAPTLDAGGAFDTGQVSDPCLSPRITPAGRLQVRVLYTGYDGPPGATNRDSAIGLAARYGTSGALARAASVVYSVSKHEGAPALFEWAAGSMLYVHQDFGTSPPIYPGIAAAFAPAEQTLPTPTAAADGP